MAKAEVFCLGFFSSLLKYVKTLWSVIPLFSFPHLNLLNLISSQEIQQVKTLEELEAFMLKHGENIVDTLGAEVDRLEKDLKVNLTAHQ